MSWLFFILVKQDAHSLLKHTVDNLNYILIADNPPFVFYFRVKFYVSEPSRLKEEYTRWIICCLFSVNELVICFHFLFCVSCIEKISAHCRLVNICLVNLWHVIFRMCIHSVVSVITRSNVEYPPFVYLLIITIPVIIFGYLINCLGMWCNVII